MPEHEVLDKVYDPRTVEPDMYARWEQCGAFASNPADTPHEQTFCIVIPPPNVTGALHLGHALNNTLQDILVRYHRMRGFNTLWQPGTDHAGIATQAVVERRIRELEGKSRHELGRSELVRRIWDWKDEYEQRIVGQLKEMGCSCDWSRLRFTLDDGLVSAVRHQFFKMFADGLIFRGKRLVNWDTELQTAVANDEVYYETVKGSFWHFKYPVIEPQPGEPEHVIIATTRPETMLGDTAVAVCPNPAEVLEKAEAKLRQSLERANEKDRNDIEARLEALTKRRASHLKQLEQLASMAAKGRRLQLPLTERQIPLIADEWADPSLGTGCVKITPAHDPNDYEVGIRHDLPMINVLTPDGKIAQIVEPDGTVNPHSGDYEGLAFSGAGREKVVAAMKERELLDDVVDRDREIGHSDRSKAPIEPFLSDQWFVATGDQAHGKGSEKGIRLGNGSQAPGLAQAAIEAVEDGRVTISPPRYAKSYLDWLSEKRDWCISRQLWWGHRIPIWSEETPLTEQMTGGDGIGIEVMNQLPGKKQFSPYVHATMSQQSVEEQHLLCCWDGEPTETQFKVLNDNDVKQDPDVLDTWFSSALWPFSTLGWPEQTPHLRQYYPGSVLITSRDIITNWVARMVMFGLYAVGDVPFDRVYIHPKILDGRGETMSKSKGNGVDPVDIIHTHGADALRYAMADMCSETQDIRMPVEYVCPHCGKLVDQSIAIKAETQARKSRGERIEARLQPADCSVVACTAKDCGKQFATRWAEPEVRSDMPVARETSDKFDIGRNFCNKLWNAARFAFLNLEGTQYKSVDLAKLNQEDKWILARLSQTVRRYHQCLADYQFAASIKELRDFFWECLCDWYIELTKPRLGEGSSGDPARQILAFCMDQVLRLFHPTMPFITERLWEQLNGVAPERGIPGIAELKTDTPLILADFPPNEGYGQLDNDDALKTFAELQAATRGARELRSSAGVSPKDAVDVTIALPKERAEAFRTQSHIFAHMAGVAKLTIDPEANRPPNSGTLTLGDMRIYVHGISNDEAEKTRAGKELQGVDKKIAALEGKLGNPKFLANAKPEIVEAEQKRLSELASQRQSLVDHLAELGA